MAAKGSAAAQQPTAAASLSLPISNSGSVCLDPGISLLCLNYSTSSTNISFSVSCAPPQGMIPGQTYWCGFGLSYSSVGDMFPSQATIIQYSPAGLFVEDRDSFVGYRSPPCFATQVSQLLSGSSVNGTLLASWTRPLRLPKALTDLHYVNITLGANMTLIGASSTDTSVASAPCNPEMQTHTYCAMGQQIVF